MLVVTLVTAVSCGSNNDKNRTIQPSSRGAFDAVIAEVAHTVGDDPGAEFDGAPVASILLSHGRALAVDSKSLRLLFTDSVGMVVSTAGKRGSGPGEFQEIADVFQVKSGEIEVFDPIPLKITRYSESGRYLGEQHFVDWPESRSLRIVGRFSGGGYLGMRTLESKSGPRHVSIVTDSVILVAGSIESKPHVLLTLPSRKSLRLGDARVSVPELSPRAVAICGDRFVVVHDTIHEVFDLNATVIEKRLLPLVAVGNRRSRVDRVVEQALTLVQPASIRPSARSLLVRELENSGRPSGFILIDQAGSVWLRSGESGSPLYRFTNGRPTAAMKLPSPHLLLQADGVRMLALRPESDTIPVALNILRIPNTNRTVSTKLPVWDCGRSIRF